MRDAKAIAISMLEKRETKSKKVVGAGLLGGLVEKKNRVACAPANHKPVEKRVCVAFSSSLPCIAHQWVNLKR